MIDTFELRLSALNGASVQVRDDDNPEDYGQANIVIVFGDGTELQTCYWRAIKRDNVISSFDHRQKYGLASEVNAKQDLRRTLESPILTVSKIDRNSGDLHFTFSDGATLQVFGFSSYEVWHMSFPDGRVEYSNYARKSC
jgi:hypothetical protein